MIKIFADGANLQSLSKHNQDKKISGFTTNPTLMKKAGILDYKKFALDALKIINNKPISFEVFADEFDAMENQALLISSWSDNINVKIPITNTKGESSIPLIERLVKQNVKLNITAVMTIDQVRSVSKVLSKNVFSITSVFCGRIADTGIDPITICKESSKILEDCGSNLLWASPREVLNIFQAEQSGCKIITLTDELLSKMKLINKDLNEFSLETVKMFYNDAIDSGFAL